MAETNPLPVLPVQVLPAGKTLQARPGESILAAALRGGHMLPHSCRNGVCGTCKARLLEGRVDLGAHQASALSHAQRQQGYVLTCQASPLTPVTIECQLVQAAEGIPLRRLAARVLQLERLAPDVMRIRLKLPAKDRLQYLPGQYIDIVMNGGLRRSLSLANPEVQDDCIELHLRNYGGPFSTHVFNTMKQGDLLRVEGPFGSFFVREESARPIIFVASGTGFAPIKAMIEDQSRKAGRRAMTLYWGGRRPADLYLNDMARDWVRQHGLNYVPVVSDARPEDAWGGRTGFVHRAVMEDHADLSRHEVYACGAPVVVESARKDFVAARGLPERSFFADLFAPGAAPAPA